MLTPARMIFTARKDQLDKSIRDGVRAKNQSFGDPAFERHLGRFDKRSRCSVSARSSLADGEQSVGISAELYRQAHVAQRTPLVSKAMHHKKGLKTDCDAMEHRRMQVVAELG